MTTWRELITEAMAPDDSWANVESCTLTAVGRNQRIVQEHQNMTCLSCRYWESEGEQK